MKIYFFDFTVNFGGAPQGSLYLMSRLKDAGYQVGVIDVYGNCKEYSNKAKEYNLDHHILLKKYKKMTIGYNGKPIRRILSILSQSFTYINILVNLRKIISKKKPEIIIVNNEKSLFFLKIIQKIINFKIILYFRGEGIPEQLPQRFVNSLVNDTSHVVAHSKVAIENLKNAGVPHQHLSFIPNCIELERFSLPNKSTSLAKYKKIKLILAAARLTEEKGHHIAIEAVNKLKQKNIEVDLLIPGVIATGFDDSYLKYLNDLIAKYQLENNVHFIGWRDNLIEDIVQCHIVVLPSHTEGFPRSVIEAMIHKVPVCATPVGGIPEAITHNKTGMLFDIDDSEQLFGNLKKLIENEGLYQSIVSNAFLFSKNYFHPEKNTQGMIQVLNKV